MRARTILILGSLLAASACSSNSPAPAAQAAPTTTAPAPSGTDAILAAAGPLAAHIENTNQLICDADQAHYGSNGSGVYVEIDQFPPPGILSITVTTKDGNGGGNQQYTLMPGDTGHTFILPGLALSNVNEIDVSANSNGSAGTCQASAGQ